MEVNYKELGLMNQALLHMAGITVYRNILKDEIVNRYSQLMQLLGTSEPSPEKLLGCYHEILSLLISRYVANKQAAGDLWKNHVIQLVLSDENAFSLACEKSSDMPKGILEMVKMDLKRIHTLFQLDGNTLRNILEYKVSMDLPSWEIRPASNTHTETGHCNAAYTLFHSKDWSNETGMLSAWYRQSGCGIFSKYKAFRWIQTEFGGSLSGIEKPDPIRLSQLIGYEKERSVVINNTLQFLNGLPCNNVLLYGDRGTGKSAAVKAILNEYADRKLRLIEVSKYHLKHLPYIMEALQNRGMRFIVFIDDLSFESDETSYRELKSILEGGIEAKPENIVIYATSNRRHLIKEYFSERSTSDEVGSQDTMQEKLSLSDRFGITVTFSLPDKETYLQIVQGLAKQRCLDIDPEVLKAEALKWELQYNGRSPRTARQFVDHLEGELKLANPK